MKNLLVARLSILLLLTFTIQSAQSSSGFQIFVRNLEGKTVTVNDVKDNMKISELLLKIFDKVLIPLDLMNVRTGEKLLRVGTEEKPKKVSDYKIKKESVLYVVLFLRSGS